LNTEFAGTLAGDLDLAQQCTQTPNVSGVLAGLLGPVTIKLITSKIKGGLAKDTFQEFSAFGNLQPFQLRELELLPEGERAWKWYALFCDTSIDMKEGDYVVIGTKKFRVMKDADWSTYGYHRYNLVEGYDHAH
jgi:hypothetical protein